jgi:hypothetical protein
MKQLPFQATKPIVFTVVKNGERREVTIPADKAEEFMPEPFPFAFALMSGGGEIRILKWN